MYFVPIENDPLHNFYLRKEKITDAQESINIYTNAVDDFYSLCLFEMIVIVTLTRHPQQQSASLLLMKWRPLDAEGWYCWITATAG